MYVCTLGTLRTSRVRETTSWAFCGVWSNLVKVNEECMHLLIRASEPVSCDSATGVVTRGR